MDQSGYSIIDISKILRLPLSRVRVLARIHASKIPSEVRNGERVYPETSLDAFREILDQTSRPSFASDGDGMDAEQLEEGSEPETAEDTPIYYSVSKISQMTGISESKILEYRRRFTQRIPSMGEGKEKVHPEEAVPIFEEIHRQQSGQEVLTRQGRRHLDLQQVSEELGLSRSLLYAYISEEGDRIPKFKEGKRWIFPEEALEAFREIRSEREARKRRKVEGLYSIRDIARKTGISESTLHQYKRALGDELPSEGEGRNRRYPEEAIEVFLAYRKTGGGRRVPGSYSLSDVSKETGIPEHTLLYYRRTYPEEIPVAKDRSTRIYTAESIQAFQKIKERASRRGGRRGTRKSKRIGELEGRIEDLERRWGRAETLIERICEQLGLDPGREAE